MAQSIHTLSNLLVLDTKELTNVVSVLWRESCIYLLLFPYLRVFGLYGLIDSYGLIYKNFLCSYYWHLMLTGSVLCTGSLVGREAELQVEPTIWI